MYLNLYKSSMGLSNLLNRLYIAIVCGVISVSGTSIMADDEKHAEDHQHEDHPVTGRKIPSPGPDDIHKFLKVDEENKKVTLPVMATYNDANYGMNFNGHHRGQAIYTIPKDWKVTIQFQNLSPVPHSAVVVEKVMVRKLQVGEPYFEGAASKEPLKGLVKKDEFSFTVDEAGKFAIACGFPAHAASGHWIALNVSKSEPLPKLEFKTDSTGN